MSDSLLPANASLLERAIESAFEELLVGIEAPFPELLDPQRTPVAFLPYLASDRGVSEWVSDAPEAEKRATIARAWPLKRQAGKGQALAYAVEALGFDVDLVPWHEQEPAAPPFALRIEARTDETVDETKTQRLVTRLGDAKAERDTLTLRMLRESHQTLTIGSAIAQGTHLRLGPRPAVPAPATATPRTGQAYHVARTTTIHAREIRISVEPAQRHWRGALHEYRHLTIRG